MNTETVATVTSPKPAKAKRRIITFDPQPDVETMIDRAVAATGLDQTAIIHLCVRVGLCKKFAGKRELPALAVAQDKVIKFLGHTLDLEPICERR